jgi:NDP-sugar pyrophosphorylase family protein
MVSIVHNVSERCRDLVEAETKAVLLVGGLGTRLRALAPSTPKPLAPIGDCPFLELLIRQLYEQGIQRLVMCTGYLAEHIENEFGNGQTLGVTIEYSKEPHPLGTAGAIKFAQRHLQSIPEFVVMNGDSFLEIDLRQLLDFHRAHRGLITMAMVSAENAGRYGTVHTDSSNRVTEFCEKTGNDSAGLINGGVYVFSRAVLDLIPDGQVRLEKDVIPRLLNHGVYGSEQRGIFIDIGTPVDYKRAQHLLEHLNRASHQDALGRQSLRGRKS